MTRSIAEHRAPLSASPTHALAIRFAKTAAVFLVAILIAIAGTHGTYAFLSASKPIPLVPATGATSVTIVAGTANLSLSTATISAANLYPGEVRTTDVVVGTSGTTSLGLSVSSIAGTTTTTFTASAAGNSCSSGLPAVTSGSLGITVTPTTPVTLCVRIGLAVNAPASAAGTTGTVVINLLGSQV